MKSFDMNSTSTASLTCPSDPYWMVIELVDEGRICRVLQLAELWALVCVYRRANFCDLKIFVWMLHWKYGNIHIHWFGGKDKPLNFKHTHLTVMHTESL